MPDQIEPITPHEGQTDWPAMLHDLEKRVEVLSDALEGVKLSMRRLALAEPWLEEAPTPQAAPPPETAPVDMAEATQFYAFEPAPSYHFDEPGSAFDEPAVVQYDDDAREAVRRAVEDAKTPMTPGAWRDETADYVTEDKPEVSWVTVPDDGSAPEPLPTFDDVRNAAANDEDAREAVRRAVEQAKAELSASTRYPAAADEDEATREAVRRTVEQAKGGLGFGWGSAMPGTPQDDEIRDQASHSYFVEEAVDASEPRAEEPAAPVDDEEAAREAVRQAVEQAKAEMARAGQVPGSEPLDDEEAAREAVRKAVMQARTEMATTGSLSEDVPEPVVVAPAFVVPPPHRAERVHPPTITIEDPEGRVELARVYNLLKVLDCAANSSLLNYSSRQVSVQLSDNKHAPDGDNVGEAVRDVFERENNVSVDGLNVIVKLGDDYVNAA
jgi:hypothetical protein